MRDAKWPPKKNNPGPPSSFPLRCGFRGVVCARNRSAPSLPVSQGREEGRKEMNVKRFTVDDRAAGSFFYASSPPSFFLSNSDTRLLVRFSSIRASLSLSSEHSPWTTLSLVRTLTDLAAFSALPQTKM